MGWRGDLAERGRMMVVSLSLKILAGELKKEYCKTSLLCLIHIFLRE